jgi:hypothetical protein
LLLKFHEKSAFFFFISWQKWGNQRRNPIESHVPTLRQQETDGMMLLLNNSDGHGPSVDFFKKKKNRRVSSADFDEV